MMKARDNSLTRYSRLANENSNTRNRLPIFELLTSGASEAPNITGYCHCSPARGHPPELDGETLLLKTPHTSIKNVDKRS